MNNLNFYTYFRRELDKMCVPIILETLETRAIMYRGRQVGILCTNGNYIDFMLYPPFVAKG